MIELLLIVLLVIIAMVVIITAKLFAPQFAGLIRSHAGGAPDPNKLAPLSAVVSNNPALWTNIKSAVDVPSFVGAVTTMRDAIIAADLNAAITLKEVTSADIKALWQAKQVCDVFGYISAQDDTTRPCSQDISDLADDGKKIRCVFQARRNDT
jgi:hypothetical protein